MTRLEFCIPDDAIVNSGHSKADYYKEAKAAAGKIQETDQSIEVILDEENFQITFANISDALGAGFVLLLESYFNGKQRNVEVQRCLPNFHLSNPAQKRQR